jgi:2-(1,2-epoxy-1,2-dihydrophenyl)acetyl-CoA isomerase
MAYTTSGLTPDGSSTFYLARLVGLRRAQELVLTNRVLSAEEALDWGLVNKVVPDDEVLSTSVKLAEELATGPTEAFGSAKRLLLASAGDDLEAQMERETRAIASAASGPDGKEGIAAFVAKRTPKFVGR